MRVKGIAKKPLEARLLAVVFAAVLLMAQFRLYHITALADGESITLDICVYYNDTGSNWYQSEVGEQIEIFGEGTYTLTFDATKDLSAEAQSAGVMSLTNLGAIYLVDDAYLSGRSPRSNVDSFDIMYESIKLDGKELTITQTEPVSALKAAGQVDTNGPINAWDGCFIADDEYTIDEGNVLNFTDAGMPRVIEITFTVSNMYFKGSDVPATTAPNSDGEGEEPEETTTEESAETETSAEAAATTEAEQPTTASAENSDDSGSLVPVIVTVILVVLLIAVVVAVIIRLNKKKA